MRKGVLELCILRILSHGEAYTSDLSDRLKQAELLVVEGTLYPLLTRMKNAGWLVYRWAESKNGPPRKYYALTKEGVQQLELLDRQWGSFVEAVQSLNCPSMAENFDSGQPVGPKDGNPMGPKDGNPMGPKDGNPMGPKDGNPMGPKDGNPMGSKDGNPMGPKDGNPTGPKDGNPMGPKDGNPTGPKDGNPMGPKDGNPIESHAGNTIELKPGQP